jgi:uncharacterized protein (TIGR03118 family)
MAKLKLRDVLLPVMGLTLLASVLLPGLSCSKKNGYNNPPTPTNIGNFQQVNLVSDVPGSAFGVANADPNLLNAWGLAINPNGIFWVAGNHSGLADVYDSTGKILLTPKNIPSPTRADGGAPSGAVFISTGDFTIPSNGMKAAFVYVTEDGTVTAWAPTMYSFALTVDNSASGAVYKGVTLANNNGSNYLYATDFIGGKIDVFDKNFNPVSMPFKDPNLTSGPGNYGPFNIQNIGGKLYVAYAKVKNPVTGDDQAGAGNGYVDIFNPDGSFVKRFISNGALNSPWGLAQAPANSGFPFHSIVVGNFGDGWINVYDSTGVYLGPASSNGNPLVIDGLWALCFASNAIPTASAKLFFTAGPNAEAHGLFGYIHAQ